MEEPRAPRVAHDRLLRRVVAHRWPVILIGILVCGLPALGWALFMTDSTYEATATVFLVREKSDPAYLRDLLAPEANSLYLALLTSKSLSQAVVEALPKESRDELSRHIGFRDYLLVAMNHIRRLQGREVVVFSPTELAVRELQDTRMNFAVSKDGTVNISATAFNPRVAVDLANTYVEVLLARSGQFARQQNRGTRELLENLLNQARTTQGEAEESLRKFQGQAGTRIKLPEEARLDMMKLAQLETGLSDVQVSREIAQQKLAYLNGQEKPGVVAAPDPSTTLLRDRVTQLETKLATLSEKYTEQHPLVRAAQDDLQDAQQRLRTTLQPQQAPKPRGTILRPLETASLSKQMADLEVELVSMQAREQTLRRRIAEVKRSLSVMGSKEQEYADLTRTVESQRNVVAMLGDKLTSARINEQGQIRGIQIIDLANLPKQPSSKHPLRIMMLGLLGGAALGFGFASLREYTLQVIETEEEATGITEFPALGSIPTVPPGTVAPREGPTSFFHAEDVTLELCADACRSIRTTIQCQSLDEPLKKVLVTSAGAGDGKSTLVVNLASAFLETSTRVVLIDADLRRPTLHKAFNVPKERGLSDMLRDGDLSPELFREIAPGLELLPAGTIVTNPSALLGSKRFAAVLELAAQRADVVIIDAPPLLAVSDALPMAKLVDGVVFVARAGVTRRRLLERASEQLRKVSAHVLGLVINGLSARDTRHHYAAYYSYEGHSRSRKRRTKKGSR